MITLDKLHELYEEDMLTKQVFLEYKAIRSRQIKKQEEELKDLRKVILDEGNYPTIEQIYERAGRFRELWSIAVSGDKLREEWGVEEAGAVDCI